ncbi:MAG: glycosyltransferase [Candidatus Sericytochromatia bacterium]|nr:glycosyltransferase [Candidatus Sericytochromatia bacterium]
MFQEIKARVSLLMAACNPDAHLLKSIDSLLAQTHSNFTLTLIDDGSHEPLSERLQSRQDPRLKILRLDKPQGLIPALNLAMQKSKPAVFYAVVYASCFYSPNFLYSLLETILRKPKASGVYSYFCAGNGYLSGRQYKELRFDENELLIRDMLGPTVLFRHDAFKQAGGLFVSEKKGLLETWQRMSQKYGPFEQVNTVLVRQQKDPYLPQVLPREIDPEKDLYPHLKVRFLMPEDQQIDPEWLQLLKESGHALLQTDDVMKQQQMPQVVLCSQLSQLETAVRHARYTFTPLIFVLNDPELAEMLALQPRHHFLLNACTLATRTLKVAKILSQHQHQPLVYMPGMTRREVNRLLSRVPMLLHRHSAVVLIRSYGGPEALNKTLLSLEDLHHPNEFGHALIYCADRDPRTLRWLEEKGLSCQLAPGFAYFPHLLGLLKQLPASWILGIDAGIQIPPDWFYTLWPQLADPRAGMVSGHINAGVSEQRLPFAVRTRAELMAKWSTYHPLVALESVAALSDAAFLMRKQTFEWLLARYPETRPLSDERLLSEYIRKAKQVCLLNRQTVAHNNNLFI